VVSPVPPVVPTLTPTPAGIPPLPAPPFPAPQLITGTPMATVTPVSIVPGR
jgi:hypothetical protein